MECIGMKKSNGEDKTLETVRKVRGKEKNRGSKENHNTGAQGTVIVCLNSSWLMVFDMLCSSVPSPF